MHAYRFRFFFASLTMSVFCGVAVAQVEPCSTDDQCNDGISCTEDACHFPEGECQHTRNDALCPDDAFACTDTVGCDPTNLSADPTTGCVYSRNDANCFDLFACTDDGCDPDNPAADAEGCVYSRNDANCDDTFSCTTDGCDPTNPAADAEGCVYSRDDFACEDFDLCTVNGCDPTNPNADPAGCISSPAADCCEQDSDCNDGIACTRNECHFPEGICQFPRDDSLCDDGVDCTDDGCDPTNPTSDPATGCFAARNDLNCDDGISCTIDGCNPDNPAAGPDGCGHARDDSACGDGIACTIGGCNPDNPAADPATGCGQSREDSLCEDGNPCTSDGCDPTNPTSGPDGCFHTAINSGCCLSDADCPLDDPANCVDNFCNLQTNSCEQQAIPNCVSGLAGRVSSTQKGSLLFWSKVELRWNAAGDLVQDTILSLTNDYPRDVYVQLYFVNGDPELDPVFSSGPAPILISEGEPGWNWVDCGLLLTPDQPVYWSAATGDPLGCQPFEILDPDLGNGPGRPDPEGSTDRVLRGFVVGWATDAAFANEICWNHLSGKATIVNYADATAWEYNAWAFQSRVCGTVAVPGAIHPEPGVIRMNGLEYDWAFDMLLFDFFASGSTALSSNGNLATVDTDLTLHLVGGDFRENSRFPFNPITTKAHFDIWNMNERKLSNTRRCITCWDQTLISNYGPPNNMLLANLQSDKGKARIDGKQADECEENCLRELDGSLMDLEDIIDLLGDLFGEVDIRCSRDASLLGVAAKHLTFGNGDRAVAGSNLVGMGLEDGQIRFDAGTTPPGTLREEAYERIGREVPRDASGTSKPSSRLEPAGSTKGR